MKDEVAVSVIIPLYNRGEYIRRTLNSVLRQTIQNFEIVVVDGHSADEGPAIVKNFHDPRIVFTVFEGERGVSAQRNYGINLAKSDFIAFLDADDEFSPRHLEILLGLREKFPDAGLYATAYKTMEQGNVVKTPNVRAIPPSPWEGLIPSYLQSAMSGMPFVTCCVGMPKNLFQKTGGFLPGVQWGEDEELWLRIALNYRIAFSWEGEIVWHREARNRTGNTLGLMAFEREPAVTLALTALKNNSVSPSEKPFLKEFIAKFEITRTLWNIKAGNPKKAREILKNFETRLFYQRKIRLLIFSYIPIPLFRFSWKTIRLIRQHLFHKDYRYDPWLK
jgi:glycosyltransferase involved in cell wall biosynthesis